MCRLTFRIVALVAAMLLLGFPARSQQKIISNDSIVLIENTLKKVGKNVNFTIIPGPISGTTEKLGFVILPMVVYRLNTADTLSPPSSTAVLFYFDFNGSWLVATRQSFYWNQNKWRAFFSAGTGKLRIRFYGISNVREVIGNDDSAYVWTNQSGWNVSTSCYRKLYRGLYGGLEYKYLQSELKGTDSAAQSEIEKAGAPAGSMSESILIPTFVWDNRDHIFWSTRGYYAGMNLQLSNRFLLSSRDYNVVSGWVNGYHRLSRKGPGCILAWHFYIQSGWGDLPFIRYAAYGQGDDVTGYTRGKYVDFCESTVQAELRYEVWKFISCGGYLGTGKVFSSFTTFGPPPWLHYGGIRLYLNILPSKNIRVRLDAAFARKDWGFYVGVGQAF